MNFGLHTSPPSKDSPPKSQGAIPVPPPSSPSGVKASRAPAPPGFEDYAAQSFSPAISRGSAVAPPQRPNSQAGYDSKVPSQATLGVQSAQPPAAGQASRQLQLGITQPVFVQSATGEFMQDSWMSAAVASSFAKIRSPSPPRGRNTSPGRSEGSRSPTLEPQNASRNVFPSTTGSRADRDGEKNKRGISSPGLVPGTPGVYGLGMRVSPERIVIQVNELMDGQGRIMSDTVRVGDVLIEVDGFLFSDNSDMESVRSVIFGEHGSLASLALQRGTGSNAEIYRVTAMRHVPIKLWHSWQQSSPSNPPSLPRQDQQGQQGGPSSDRPQASDDAMVYGVARRRVESDVDESPPRYGLELNKSPDAAPPQGLGISPARLKPDAPPLLRSFAEQGAPMTPPRRGSNKAAAAPPGAPGAAESPASLGSLQHGVGVGAGAGALMESPASLARAQSHRTPNAQRDMRRALFMALQATVDHTKNSGDAEMVRLVDHLGTQIMTLEASSARERKEMLGEAARGSQRTDKVMEQLKQAGAAATEADLRSLLVESLEAGRSMQIELAAAMTSTAEQATRIAVLEAEKGHAVHGGSETTARRALTGDMDQAALQRQQYHQALEKVDSLLSFDQTKVFELEEKAMWAEAKAEEANSEMLKMRKEMEQSLDRIRSEALLSQHALQKDLDQSIFERNEAVQLMSESLAQEQHVSEQQRKQIADMSRRMRELEAFQKSPSDDRIDAIIREKNVAVEAAEAMKDRKRVLEGVYSSLRDQLNELLVERTAEKDILAQAGIEVGEKGAKDLFKLVERDRMLQFYLSTLRVS